MDGGMRGLQTETIPIFSEGIGLVLYRWSALRTAVENEWGGPESRLKADQIAADVLSRFTHSKKPLCFGDLVNVLDDGMLSLNVEVEDGSIEEVAENLMVMHEEFLDANFRSIEVLREANLNQAAHPHVAQIVNDDEDDEEENGDDDENVIEDDNSSNMNVDNANLVNRPVNGPLPTVASEADDGWIAVTNGRRRGRRN